MKEMVSVEYIPISAVFGGNLKVISTTLSDIHNNDRIVKWEIEYLSSTDGLYGAIITVFYEVEDGGLNYV